MACLFGHKWNGCKCSKCSITRDEQHDWDLCNGKCYRCGKTHIEQHERDGCICKRCNKELHDWNGCKCEKCGKERHDRQLFKCYSKCLRCGDVFEYSYEHHDWLDGKCSHCGKTLNKNEFYKFEKRIANGIINNSHSFYRYNYSGKVLDEESMKKAIQHIVSQSVLLDIAINAYVTLLQFGELAAKKLTDSNDISEYIISRRIYSSNYDRSVAWELLQQISDVVCLQKIAKLAEIDRFRWRACKLSGGHIFDSEAVNKCKCTICGFQYHKGVPNCERCGGLIHTPHFSNSPHTSITYSDGTEEVFSGYDGCYTTERHYFV